MTQNLNLPGHKMQYEELVDECNLQLQSEIWILGSCCSACLYRVVVTKASDEVILLYKMEVTVATCFWKNDLPKGQATLESCVGKYPALQYMFSKIVSYDSGNATDAECLCISFTTDTLHIQGYKFGYKIVRVFILKWY